MKELALSSLLAPAASLLAAAVADGLFGRFEEAESARASFVREARRELAEKGPAPASREPAESSSGLRDGPIHPHVADRTGDIQRLGCDFVQNAGEPSPGRSETKSS